MMLVSLTYTILLLSYLNKVSFMLMHYYILPNAYTYYFNSVFVFAISPTYNYFILISFVSLEMVD